MDDTRNIFASLYDEDATRNLPEEPKEETSTHEEEEISLEEDVVEKVEKPEEVILKEPTKKDKSNLDRVSNEEPFILDTPIKSTIGFYDSNLDDFITNFSRMNQRHGGAAITKSQLVEAIVEVVYYYTDIRPNGYNTIEEFKEDLKEKLK